MVPRFTYLSVYREVVNRARLLSYDINTDLCLDSIKHAVCRQKVTESFFDAMKANEEQLVEVCTSVLYRDSITVMHMALNHGIGGSIPSPDAKKMQMT